MKEKAAAAAKDAEPEPMSQAEGESEDKPAQPNATKNHATNAALSDKAIAESSTTEASLQYHSGCILSYSHPF